MNLLSLLLGSMTQTSSVNSLSEKSGVSSALVQKLLIAALPLLIKSMTSNASSGSGAASLLAALAQHKNDKSLADQFSTADAEDGSKILGHILGSDTNAVMSQLASQTGMSEADVNSVLSNAAPALLSSLSATTAAAGTQSGSFDLGSAATSDLMSGILGDSSASAASGMNLLGSLLGGGQDTSAYDGSSLLGALLGLS